MAGYTRQDTANNIANGSVIDADDLDGEFNAVESAFNASSGHAHDGSAGQGAPVTKVGPGQDIIVGTSTVLPKANNIIDLGSSAAQFKDGFFDGILYTDTANIGVNGYTTIVDNAYTVSNGDLTLDVVGDITLDADGGDVLLKDGGVSFGKLTNNSNQLSIFSGNVEALRLNGSATSALGTLAVTGNTTVGGTLAITGNTTIASANVTLNSGNIVVGGTVSATGGFTGALTGNVTGTVSSVANHDTGDIVEGSNLYHTTARARAAISATGSLSYNSTTGVISFTQGNTDTVAEGSSNLYHTTARARDAISATGNISYNSSTGVISLATNQDVTFDDVIVGGNLTVNGTTTTVNSNTVNIGDNIITLNSDETGTPSQDAGITIERGTSTNKSLVWTESTDKWGVGSETFVAGTFEGNLTGNVTGNLTGAVTGNASTATALATARNIALSGDVTGSASFNGTGNISISATVANNSHNHTLSNISDVTATATELNKMDGVTATTAEINYVDGVTSGIQAQINALTSALANSGAPSGLVSYFANTSAPTGYLECNGAAVSRSTYSDLFAAIGTTHGSGNGSSTFNVPDLRGEFIRGWDNSRGIDSGRAFGSSQDDALQGHGHMLTTQSNGPGGGSGTFATGVGRSSDRVLQPVNLSGYGTVRYASETRSRNVALLPCIKT